MQPYICSFNRHLSGVICPSLVIFDKHIDMSEESSVQPLKSIRRKQKLCFPTRRREMKQTTQELLPANSLSWYMLLWWLHDATSQFHAFVQLLLPLASLCPSPRITSYLPAEHIHYSRLSSSSLHSLSPRWASLLSVQLTILLLLLFDLPSESILYVFD